MVKRFCFSPPRRSKLICLLDAWTFSRNNVGKDRRCVSLCVSAFAPNLIQHLLYFSDRLLKSHVNFTIIFYIKTKFSLTAAARLKGVAAADTPHAKKSVARRLRGGEEDNDGVQRADTFSRLFADVSVDCERNIHMQSRSRSRG